MRPTVRTETSGCDSKLQMRNSPAFGMGLLQVVDLHDQRQPDFAGVLRATGLVGQAGEVLGFEPLDPGIHRRPRHLQHTHDADFRPALVVEPDDLEAGVRAIWMGVVVRQA